MISNVKIPRMVTGHAREEGASDFKGLLVGRHRIVWRFGCDSRGIGNDVVVCRARPRLAARSSRCISRA
eukprot:3786908-Prymnesium_polylepis.1